MTGFLREGEKATIYAVLPAAVAQVVRERVDAYEAEHAHTASPAERGETFVVPRLMAWVQGNLVFADTDRLLEYFDWSLLDHGHQLTPAQFDIMETADRFGIHLEGDQLTLAQNDHSDQLMLDVPVDGWSEPGLVTLLAQQLRSDDVRPAELLRWLTNVVAFLVTDRHIPLAALMRCRFILARRPHDRLAVIRQDARASAYQTCLFAPDAAHALSSDEGFMFAEGMFVGVPAYRGTYRFKHHFLPAVPAFDGEDGGAEFKAAQLVGAVSEVEYWVRNVANHPSAFSLPLVGGQTYPDFVAKVKDGRTLVVEYKGAHLVRDAAEKRLVGELWQAASEGRGGVYVFAEKDRGGLDVRDQIRAALATS
ncbi:MAG TPA: hypothetical protein VF695_05635 [Sphingomonas sp.]